MMKLDPVVLSALWSEPNIGIYYLYTTEPYRIQTMMILGSFGIMQDCKEAHQLNRSIPFHFMFYRKLSNVTNTIQETSIERLLNSMQMAMIQKVSLLTKSAMQTL